MKNKKILLISIAVLTGVGALGAGYFVFLRKDQTAGLPTTPQELNTVDYGPSEPTDKVQPSSKDKIIESQKKEGTDTVAPNESKFSANITNTSQQDQTVYVRAIINDSLNGTCKLKLENGANTVSREAPYSPQASYAICQGFNIPASDFPAGGTWKITLTAIDKDGRQATTTSSIEVKK